MKKLYLILGLFVLSTISYVIALTPEQEGEAAFYAKSKGWEFPKYQSGWEALYAKTQSKECTWIRERDGRSFIGQYVRTSQQEKVCLPISKKKVVAKKKFVVVTPLNITSNSTTI